MYLGWGENIGVETSWKVATWNIENMAKKNFNMDVMEIRCEKGSRTGVDQDCFQWLALL
jgi:hypothetical protein